MSPADRVVVDWRISEYELLDDNEASHVDKPVVLFSGEDPSRRNTTVQL